MQSRGRSAAPEEPADRAERAARRASSSGTEEHAPGLRRALIEHDHVEDHRELGGVEHQLHVRLELLAARVEATPQLPELGRRERREHRAAVVEVSDEGRRAVGGGAGAGQVAVGLQGAAVAVPVPAAGWAAGVHRRVGAALERPRVGAARSCRRLRAPAPAARSALAIVALEHLGEPALEVTHLGRERPGVRTQQPRGRGGALHDGDRLVNFLVQRLHALALIGAERAGCGPPAAAPSRGPAARRFHASRRRPRRRATSRRPRAPAAAWLGAAGGEQSAMSSCSCEQCR